MLKSHDGSKAWFLFLCANVLKIKHVTFFFRILTKFCAFADTMVFVAENRLIGMDQTILSLPERISEAMYTMMEKIETINAKVCWNIGACMTV